MANCLNIGTELLGGRQDLETGLPICFRILFPQTTLALELRGLFHTLTRATL